MTTADLLRSPGGLRWASERLKSRIWAVERAFERNKAADHAVDDARIRIFVVLLFFGLLFLTLALGATRAALRHSEAQGPVAPLVSSARAELADRHGSLLALDLMHHGLYIDAREVWDAEEIRRGLTQALPRLSKARLERALRSGRRVHLIGGLTPQERASVHALGLAGVSFEPEERRVYPLGATAAHLIGFSDRGGQGLSGAERAFNEPLRADGGIGGPIELSLDLRVQSVLEEELTAAAADLRVKGAVGVVTDVHTGEILAMASYPDFDPNNPGAATPEQLLNRAAGSVYEMGSTFKGFTVAAGLESGKFTRSSTFDATQPFRIGGRVVRDFHASNKVLTLDEVFTKSSNIGTSRIALGVGTQRFSQYMADWGLLEPAKVELVESARPIKPAKWSETTLASASFGHAISVTPLQLTQAMNAVVNGGRMVPLTIRKRGPRERVTGRQVLSAATSQAMLEIMRLNVTDGSGGKADAPGLRVGGKTGTGEKVVDGRYSDTVNVSSFAAVFPTDGPLDAKRYFVLILMDEPKGSQASMGQRTGGWVAAPAAGRVINRIAPFLGVTRKADPAPETTPAAKPATGAPR
ncbi:MAG: penicillin-binding protein 2 [Proteobacteria bacterium]|nr:penicillin-binding protein 2 [Pseudomonadota bacterium]MBW3616612.1 penicillin-binding protein 2 [Pseudomonadota bacterium]